MKANNSNSTDSPTKALGGIFKKSTSRSSLLNPIEKKSSSNRATPSGTPTGRTSFSGNLSAETEEQIEAVANEIRELIPQVQEMRLKYNALVEERLRSQGHVYKAPRSPNRRSASPGPSGGKLSPQPSQTKKTKPPIPRPRQLKRKENSRFGPGTARGDSPNPDAPLQTPHEMFMEDFQSIDALLPLLLQGGAAGGRGEMVDDPNGVFSLANISSSLPPIMTSHAPRSQPISNPFGNHIMNHNPNHQHMPSSANSDHEYGQLLAPPPPTLQRQQSTPATLQPEHIDLLQMFAEEEHGAAAVPPPVAPREPLWDEGGLHTIGNPPPPYPAVNSSAPAQHHHHHAHIARPQGYGHMATHETQPFSSTGNNATLPSHPPQPYPYPDDPMGYPPSSGMPPPAGYWQQQQHPSHHDHQQRQPGVGQPSHLSQLQRGGSLRDHYEPYLHHPPHHGHHPNHPYQGVQPPYPQHHPHAPPSGPPHRHSYSGGMGGGGRSDYYPPVPTSPPTYFTRPSSNSNPKMEHYQHQQQYQPHQQPQQQPHAHAHALDHPPTNNPDALFKTLPEIGDADFFPPDEMDQLIALVESESAGDSSSAVTTGPPRHPPPHSSYPPSSSHEQYPPHYGAPQQYAPPPPQDYRSSRPPALTHPSQYPQRPPNSFVSPNSSHSYPHPPNAWPARDGGGVVSPQEGTLGAGGGPRPSNGFQSPRDYHPPPTQHPRAPCPPPSDDPRHYMPPPNGYSSHPPHPGPSSWDPRQKYPPGANNQPGPPNPPSLAWGHDPYSQMQGHGQGGTEVAVGGNGRGNPPQQQVTGAFQSDYPPQSDYPSQLQGW